MGEIEIFLLDIPTLRTGVTPDTIWGITMLEIKEVNPVQGKPPPLWNISLVTISQ